MKHVSILVPKGAAALSCIEGAYIFFTKANDFLVSMGKEPMFNVQLIGMDNEPQKYDGLFAVHPNATIKTIKKTDLIIVPAVNGNMEIVVEENKAFINWMIKQYHKGAELASLCVGSFILAATGLLKEKKCSTHWSAVNEFKQMFPDVNLVSERIITDEQGIYSSGGANSFWNLLLYIIEKYVDREMAIFFSKYYEIEIDRNNQSQFIMFNGQTGHNDEAIKDAQTYIENNFQEKISVEDLAVKFAIGRRSLERRFKKATCNTVNEYIQRVKIEAAKKKFELSRKNINEVMYDVGYADTKAFRLTFKKITGMSPLDYRNKYNKNSSIAYN
jgi:transcriptional regulator GlxA family with amidase domain